MHLSRHMHAHGGIARIAQREEGAAFAGVGGAYGTTNRARAPVFLEAAVSSAPMGKVSAPGGLARRKPCGEDSGSSEGHRWTSRSPQVTHTLAAAAHAAAPVVPPIDRVGLSLPQSEAAALVSGLRAKNTSRSVPACRRTKKRRPRDQKGAYTGWST